MNAPPVQYVRTSDGFDIAYAVNGVGRPVVLMPDTYSHLQLNWTEEDYLRPLLAELAARYQLIQYDGRGQGMSQRGLSSSHSMADHVRDLETVLDAVGLPRYVLIVRTVLGHAAVRYAIDHAERVEALVLVSVPPSGSSLTNIFTIAAKKSWDLLVVLAASSGTSMDPATLRWRLMQTITLEDYVTIVESWLKSEIADLLPQVRVPTLVVHPRDYLLRSADEPMQLAAAIPNARFRLLAGQLPFGEVPECISVIESFLADLPTISEQAPAMQSADNLRAVGLSPRELEVLRLLASGRSNQQIADELVISLNTVRRHVSNIFDKTGAANRAQAAIYARDYGLA